MLSGRAGGAFLVLAGLITTTLPAAFGELGRTAPALIIDSISTRCPADAIAAAGSNNAYRRTLSQRMTVAQNWPPDTRPAIAFRYPISGAAAMRLPGAQRWEMRSPLESGRDPRWRGDLAVIAVPAGLNAGDVVELCVFYNLGYLRDVKIVSEHELHATELERVRTAALSEGALLATTLAGAGMAIALRSGLFMALAGMLACSLLYLTATNGTLLDTSIGARLARDWPLQRIGGTGAHLLLLWSLAHFLDWRARHVVLWRIIVVIMALLLALLAVSVVPTPFMFLKSLGLFGNVLLGLSVFLLLGRTLLDARSHHPSRALLWSWSPLLLLVIWMAAYVSLTEGTPASLHLLYPLALMYACGFLFWGLARRIAEVQSQRDQEKLRAETDALTGALSRAALDALLFRFFDSEIESERPSAVLFVDFDHFKRINDDFGHTAGDLALSTAVSRIEANLREVDHVGRYGGEEFLVVLQGLAAPAALEVAERIRADIENDGLSLVDGLPPMTVSIGVAVRKPAGDTPADLLLRADKALYAAKAAGRNKVISATT